jgi:hypothetical protein
MSTDLAPAAEQRPSLLSAYAISEIKALMGRQDLNKTEIARRLGVSDMWVGRRLRGDIPIGLDELQRIAAVLEADPMELLPERRKRLNISYAAGTVGERVVAVGGMPRRSRSVVRSHRPGRAVARTRPRRGTSRPRTPVVA